MICPQVEALEQLSAALEALREAERGYQLPLVMNASVQVGCELQVECGLPQ